MFSLIGPQKTSITPLPWQSKVWVLAALGDLPSLKLTAKAPEKWWFPNPESPGTRVPLLFSGAFAVSFRECMSSSRIRWEFSACRKQH